MIKRYQDTFQMSPEELIDYLAVSAGAVQVSDSKIFTHTLDYQQFARLVAEHCATMCQHLGTVTAGINENRSTHMADSCAGMINEIFGVTDAS